MQSLAFAWKFLSSLELEDSRASTLYNSDWFFSPSVCYAQPHAFYVLWTAQWCWLVNNYTLYNLGAWNITYSSHISTPIRRSKSSDILQGFMVTFWSHIYPDALTEMQPLHCAFYSCQLRYRMFLSLVSMLEITYHEIRQSESWDEVPSYLALKIGKLDTVLRICRQFPCSKGI